MKFLLILDFDGCITCADDTLTTARAENISDMIDKFREFDIGFMILTLANKAHVFDVVRRSGSKMLMDIFDSIDIIAIDERSRLVMMDKTRGESINEKNKMIRRVMESLYNKNTSSSLVPRDILSKEELIQAYKKTKSLLTLAARHGLSHENIFFLDDNPINIKFAIEHGFRAFYVYNHSRFRSMNTLYFLDKIYNWLSMIQVNNKKVDFDFLSYHQKRNVRSQSYKHKQSDKVIHDVIKYISPQEYKRVNN